MCGNAEAAGIVCEQDGANSCCGANIERNCRMHQVHRTENFKQHVGVRNGQWTGEYYYKCGHTIS